MRILSILINIVFGYILLCVIVYFIQRRMLYYPNSKTAPEKDITTQRIDYWPSKTEPFRGFVNTNVQSSGPGVIVVFHGNAGSAWHRTYYTRVLGELGYRVILAEYPSYGDRPGKISQQSFVEDAKQTVRLAHSQYGKPVYLCGESLGAGVAAAVAADPGIPVAGVIVITPWDTLPDLAQSIYWFLPARRLVRDKYDNIQNLSEFGGKVAIAIAEYDEIIPVRHGLRLYKSLPNTKKLWTIQDAGHNTWPNMVDVAWWREVLFFLGGKE
ncbi:alpha/beta hydrolase [candidate division KSB1 bacterium]|nr:alpha/beta hydrolase [candidate division KSB1 bacterium]